MKCSAIMTHAVKSVKTTDDAFYAAGVMREHRIGFLPVRGPNDRVVGVITDRDLAVKVCGGDRPAVDTFVGQVMSRPVVSCRGTDDVSRAEREMTVHSVTRIVIVDAKGRAIGVVSRSDIARHATAPEPAV